MLARIASILLWPVSTFVRRLRWELIDGPRAVAAQRRRALHNLRQAAALAGRSIDDRRPEPGPIEEPGPPPWADDAPDEVAAGEHGHAPEGAAPDDEVDASEEAAPEKEESDAPEAAAPQEEEVDATAEADPEEEEEDAPEAPFPEHTDSEMMVLDHEPEVDALSVDSDPADPPPPPALELDLPLEPQIDLPSLVEDQQAQQHRRRMEPVHQRVRELYRQASDAAAEAETWLDAGQRDVRSAGIEPDDPAVRGLTELVHAVGQHAAAAYDGATAAYAATSVDDALAAEAQVAEAARAAADASAAARRTLFQLRSELEALDEPILVPIEPPDRADGD